MENAKLNKKPPFSEYFYINELNDTQNKTK